MGAKYKHYLTIINVLIFIINALTHSPLTSFVIINTRFLDQSRKSYLFTKN